MQVEHLSAINEARRDRRAVILVTDLENGDGRVIRESEIIDGELQADAEKAFRTGRSVTIESGGKRLFLNVLVPPPRIAVIGAVHISQALAVMAPVAGFDLRIIDPRTAFATPERFEGVDLAAEWPEDALRRRPLDAYTALVAVTHQPRIDDPAIVEALRTGCFYVGALGSRKTHARRVERLGALGITERQIGRIDAPVGLDIGAQSPAEIAVAILAAVIRAFRRRKLVLRQAR
jgi:xanthine dehydrogenase accessory factor